MVERARRRRTVSRSPDSPTAQSYSVEIRAVNVIGASATSAPASARLAPCPSAPSGAVAVAANAAVALLVDRADIEQRRRVTDYVVQVATSIGGTYITFADGTSTTTVGHRHRAHERDDVLLPCRRGECRRHRRVVAPTGATPFTVPGAPVITTVTPGDGTLTVDFTAPVRRWERHHEIRIPPRWLRPVAVDGVARRASSSSAR